MEEESRTEKAHECNVGSHDSVAAPESSHG